MPGITSLSSDILISNILPLLSPVDFLNLCSTCKSFHEFTDDQVYWRKLTTSTFRLPSQPLREEGWMELYRTLATAKVFTWGANQNERLGHGSYRGHVGTPQEAITPPGEIIVDIVSGGWSITFLTASGKLYTHGQISEYFVYPGGAHQRPSNLIQPPNVTSKIAQVSSGRSHILGLTDEGIIVEWAENVLVNGTVINFSNIETRPYPTGYSNGGGVKGTVKKVVAGWDHSVALVTGVGLVVWWQTPNGQTSMETEGEVVDGTSFNEVDGSHNDDLSKEIGEVVDFVAGSSFMVFLTKSGNVYAVKTGGLGSVIGSRPVHLRNFSAPPDERPMSFISGNFHKFAVFNHDGRVYIGTKDMVFEALAQSPRLNGGQSDQGNGEDKFLPIIMPALQHRKIVKISFGDYHSLALTSTGKVLSWGTESGACGCLGQGPREIAIKRGARALNRYGDMALDEPTEVRFDLEWQNLNNSQAHGSEPEGQQGFVFNITAAGWHSGALMLDPMRRYKKDSLKSHMATFPRHLNLPPGEAGHGGRMHPGADGETSRGGAVLQDFNPNNPLPFIGHAPPMPAPEARPPMPAMTGGPLRLGPNDRLSSVTQEARRQERLAAARRGDEEGRHRGEGRDTGGCTIS